MPARLLSVVVDLIDGYGLYALKRVESFIWIKDLLLVIRKNSFPLFIYKYRNLFSQHRICADIEVIFWKNVGHIYLDQMSKSLSPTNPSPICWNWAQVLVFIILRLWQHWLFIFETSIFTLALVQYKWRVSEHSFSSNICPRSIPQKSISLISQDLSVLKFWLTCIILLQQHLLDHLLL